MYPYSGRRVTQMHVLLRIAILCHQLGFIIPVTKLRSKRWAVYVASMGDRRGVHRVLKERATGKI